MEIATLNQAVKVLSVFGQNNASIEKVQRVIESGFLADLVNGNIDNVTRDDFRKLLGLPSLNSTAHISITVNSTFQRDMRKEGWKLESDVDVQTGEFELEFVEFLQDGEDHVKGVEMERRAKKLNANLSQRHAEAMLADQSKIPVEFRGKYYLVFTGTVWVDGGGRRDVPYLDWCSGRWYLDFYWLDIDFSRDGRLVRLCK